MALLLMSGVIFAQVQRVSGNKLTAVKIVKEINTMPVSHAKAVVDSLHYDGAQNDAIGTGGAVNFGAYAFFPAATLAPHATAGHSILSIKVYVMGATDVSAAELRIYSDTLSTNLLYSQAFTPVEGWNNVMLTSPLAVPSTGNLYIGYDITATGGHPAGCDAGPNDPNGNWMVWGGHWTHLSTLATTLTYNWNIRAMCGTLPTVPTASCTPLTWAAGNVIVTNSVTSGTFTLANIGAGTLTCSGISGLSAPYTTTFVPGSVSLATGASYTFSFTYNPTVVGANNQTVVITTNGGNVTINLTGTGISCGAINTFPWIESFEGASFPPACWAQESPDGGTGWAQIASGTTPLPGWTGGTMSVPTGGGVNAAYCTYSTGGSSSNDQWLMTPQIAVQNNQALSFYLFWFGHYQDNVDVKVSTTTNTSASFTTTLLTTDSTQYIQNDWQLFTVPIAAYASQNVYFAFNENIADNVNDGAFIGLDIVKVDVATGISEPKPDLVSVFPNPANDKLYITSNKIKSVEIFNILGGKVATYGNENIINVSDLSRGSYIVKVVTDTKVITKKINITH